MLKKGLYFFWLGMSLTSMFFYPLISTISDGLFYLQWQGANSLEFLLAFVTIASIMGTLLFCAERVNVSYVRILFLLLVCAIPFGSFGIGLLSQLKLQTGLVVLVGQFISNNSGVVYPLIVVSLLTCCYATRRWHEVAGRSLVILVLIISPLTVVTGVNVLRHGFKNTVIEINKSDATKRGTQIASIDSDIFIVVFDELDYHYLYENEVIRRDYPNFKKLTSMSDNYHGALSPSEATLAAMMGFMVGQENIKVRVKKDGKLVIREELANGDLRSVNIAKENIFSIARRKGFRTVMYGWMHPYCTMMYESLNNCRSFSLYNYSSVNEPVSISNPIFTNLILLGLLEPFGLLMVPIYSIYYHKVVSQTYDLAISTLTSNDPTFQFVHFSIPHFPFIYNGDKYDPAEDPFLQNDENYIKQLKYVDHILGRLIAELKNHKRFHDSYVVILSDHAYRIMRKGDARRIPLIVKRPGQKHREDMHETTRAEVLLRTILDKI